MKRHFYFVALSIFLVSCSQIQKFPTLTAFPTVAQQPVTTDTSVLTRQPTVTPEAETFEPKIETTPTSVPERQIVDQSEKHPVVVSGEYKGPSNNYSVNFSVQIKTDVSLKQYDFHKVYFNNDPTDEPKDQFDNQEMFKNIYGEDAQTSIQDLTTHFYYEFWSKENPGSYDQFMRLWTEAQKSGDYSKVQFHAKADDLRVEGYNPDPTTLVTPGDFVVAFVDPLMFEKNMTTEIQKNPGTEGHAYGLHINDDGKLELWIGVNHFNRYYKEGPTASGMLAEGMLWASRWNQQKRFSGKQLDEFMHSVNSPFAKIVVNWVPGGSGALFVR